MDKRMSDLATYLVLREILPECAGGFSLRVAEARSSATVFLNCRDGYMLKFVGGGLVLVSVLELRFPTFFSRDDFAVGKS